MLRMILKQALARRGRLALTLLAVVLGVTFVTGSLVLTDTSNRVFDDQFRQAGSGVDLTVRDAVSFDSAMGVEVERDPVPPSVAARARTVPGVARATTAVKGSGLLEYDGEAIVPRGPSILGSWLPRPLGSFSIREGRAPRDAGDVVVDVATARAHGIQVGDPVTIQAERARRLHVVGLAGFGDSDGLPNSTVALVTRRTAQTLLGLGHGVSEVLVVADDAEPVAATQERLAAALGSRFDVGGSQDVAAASADAAKDQLAFLQVMLLVLAGASFLIGGFLIANTFSIIVGQRTRELALLRAAGATGRQVVLAVLGEALLVGLVGSLVGVGLGVAAASMLRDVVSGFGVVLPATGLTVLPRTVALSLGLGVAVTVLSAVGPSRRAARVAPVEAMRATAPVTGSFRGRTRTGTVLLASAVAAMVAGALGAPVALLAVGAVLLVVATMLVAPALMPALAGVVGRPVRRLGVAGSLAADAPGRAPRRTAATVMALALSLALITFTASVAASVKRSIATAYSEVVTADLVVESARGEMLGGLSPAVYRKVAAAPEVAVVSRVRYGHWKDGGTTRALTAVDPATIGQVADLHAVAGSVGALADGGVVLGERAARRTGLSVGDRMPMTFSRTGERRLPVVGIIDAADAQALSTDYLVSLDTYARLYSERMDASVYVQVAPGVTTAAAAKALDRRLADLPTAEVRDQAAAVQGRAAMVDQVLGLVTVLLLFTVLIAVLGITNTLALSIVERTREIGLLRAVGMSRGQLRTMVRLEALLLAVLGLVVGVVVGEVLHAAAVGALSRSAPVTFTVPGAWLAGILLLALIAALTAGILPARRAARVPLLEAISAE